MIWSPLNRERWPLVALIVCAATLSGVYILEYVFNQAPCQMCWWQRYAWFVAAPLALAAIAVRWRGAGPGLMSAFCLLLGLVFLASFVLAAWHALFEWNIAPGPETCTVAADSLPETVRPSDLLTRPVAIPSCKDALWRLPDAPWGLSLAGMNAVLSLLMSALSLYAASRTGRKTDTANELAPA